MGGRCRHEFQDWVWSVDIHHGRVATACGDGKVSLWDALTGQPIGDPYEHRYPSLRIMRVPGQIVVDGV